MSSFQEILEIANNLVPRISPNEAKAKQDTGALIIDIRESAKKLIHQVW